ncbi:hypothetical protein M527_06430 [Sphingobium indicum IP26]|uniref:TtsA-like Glycoside hydrolase family 108 domain-containing protein n=1 Tax=Sphingobium indicum F2 TaxID=1450518 RepID=A0A8E0WUA2_9SPHN|nr:glycosyl hydrolase 108 family protein [Sphingobium indicum]EPR09760.1 hypothetical protein M527_06430 [Sphingobium indicum IP26]KER37290.1 hypothetical protein AL00_06365 [Sphingobium indicum F2]
MMGPIDYAGPLAQLANAPTFLDREIQRSLGRAQVDQAEANSALMRQKVAADIADRQQQEQYGREVSMALESGDPRAISSLIARYPQFKDALKTNWDQMDTLRQRSEMRQAAGVWSALNAGNTNAAIKIFEDRITSDRAAGQDTSEDEQAVALLKSGDPKAINTVKGQLGLFMASVVPDKFSSVVEQLGTGTDKKDWKVVGGTVGYGGDDGQWHTAYVAPQYRELEVTDPVTGEVRKSIVTVGGEGGTGPTSGAPSGGFESFYEGFLAPAEGGFVASDGRSGAPANFGVNQAANPDIDVRSLTRDQAKQIMRERYWEPSGADQISDPRLQAIHADTAVNMGVGRAKEFLAKSNGDPASYLALREQHYRKLGGKDLDGWLKRNANLARYAGVGAGGGAASVTPRVAAMGAPVAPKEKTRILTAQEVATIPGLDPNVVYQQSSEGTITPVGGQKQGQLKPLPAPVLQARASNVAALRNIDSALSLLDPKNRSEAAKNARKAIGTGTGMLGDTFTQWNDPKGVDFRAQIGQIGGIIIKDTSGAAVSLSEDQRLAKWVPMVTDTPTAAAGKLKNLKREIMQRNQAIADTFSEDQGYRSIDGGGSAPVRVRSIQEANALKPGTFYIRPDGKLMRR